MIHVCTAASESDDDDTPLGVVASLPKDDALMTKVRAILAGVNVQEFNIRELMNQLGALMPPPPSPPFKRLSRALVRACRSKVARGMNDNAGWSAVVAFPRDFMRKRVCTTGKPNLSLHFHHCIQTGMKIY